FLAFPVVAFFLLHGGGMTGFGVSWTADVLASFANSIVGAGEALVREGHAKPLAGPILLPLGKVTGLLGWVVSLAISPLTWLRDQIQALSRPVWTDLAITAVVVSALAFFISGGVRTGWRALIGSLVTFIGIAVVIALMGLDHGGLPIVD